jgi:hypothetical protein
VPKRRRDQGRWRNWFPSHIYLGRVSQTTLENTRVQARDA